MDLLELIRLGGFAGVDLQTDSLVRIRRCGLVWICRSGFAWEDSREVSPEGIDVSGFAGTDLLEPIGWCGFAGVDLPGKIRR